MNLNSHAGVPDWELVDPLDWNQWQKRAAQTNGWDTPGNRETAKGLLYSSLGIALVAKGKTALGTTFIGYGRYKDIKDGKRAQETGTKSPRGAFLDALVDKVLVAEAVPVMVKQNVISTEQAVGIIGINALNAALNGIAQVRDREPKTNTFGKWYTFGTWAGIGLKLVGKVAENICAQDIGKNAKLAGDVVLWAGSIGLGALSSVGYAKEAFCNNGIKPEATAARL